MAEQSIVVEIDLGISSEDLSITVDDQRIDLCQRTIMIKEYLNQILKDRGDFLLMRRILKDRTDEFQPESLVDRPALIKIKFPDRARVGSGHLLDIHSSRRADDQNNIAPQSVDRYACVKFFFDINSADDQDLFNRIFFNLKILYLPERFLKIFFFLNDPDPAGLAPSAN